MPESVAIVTGGAGGIGRVTAELLGRDHLVLIGGRSQDFLDDHCARIGRDPSTIERSVLVTGPPENLGEQHLPLGATLFIVLINPQDDLTEVERWVAWRDHRNAAM